MFNNYPKKAYYSGSSVFLIVLLLIPFGPNLAQADFFLHSWEDQWVNRSQAQSQLGISSSYLSSTSQYGQNGDRIIAARFDSYQRFQHDLQFNYGLSDSWTGFARLGWSSLQLHTESMSRKRSGFSDQTLGTALRVYQGEPVSVDLQVQLDFPLYSNGTSGLAPALSLGDGSTDLTTGSFLNLTLLKSDENQLTSIIGGGYTLRSQDYSSALPWTLSFQYFRSKDHHRTSGIFASLGAQGLFSLQTDPSVGTFVETSVRPSLQDGNGNSLFAGAINPSVAQIKGQIGLRSSAGWQTSLWATQGIWGRNSPELLNVGINFSTFFGQSAPAPASSLITPPVKPLAPTAPNEVKEEAKDNAQITKHNERLNLVKINKGSQNGIKVGQFFDIFPASDEANPKAMARAQVLGVRLGEAALRVTEYYEYSKEFGIEEGFLAKPVKP